MTLVSGRVPNLISGISQQPAAMRLASQAEDSLNHYPAPSKGLIKRPRTEHNVDLGELPDGTFTHFIMRDAEEKYVLTITPAGTISVRDFEGTAYTVTNQGAAYLSGMVDPSAELRAITIADHTFIVNKTRVIAQGTTTAPTRPYEALINVIQGNYGKYYRILVNGATVAWYNTPQGDSAAQAWYVDTNMGLASNLCTDLITAMNYTGGIGGWAHGGQGGFNTAPWSLGRYASVIHLQNTTTDFAIATEDGFGGRAMTAIKGRTEKFTNLPTTGPHGFTIQIANTDTSLTGYWVQFQKLVTNANGDGVWKECVAPNAKLGLDAATMPHILVRNVDGTFTFKAASWDNRVCGDVTTNPDPSFVGTTISDIFFAKNRLGVLTSENVVMSRSGEFFNFYRQTLTALLDTDPIDIAASHVKVSLLRHAVPFQQELLVFSDATQFTLKGSEILSPKTVNCTPVTELSSSPLIRPVVASASVFFAADRSGWGSLHEYFWDKALQTADHTDVSAHAPAFVPAGLNCMIASPDLNLTLLASSGGAGTIYAYKYHWQGEERVQSAWERWTFPGAVQVLNMTFDRSYVRILLKRANKVFLETMNAEPAAVDANLDYMAFLDRHMLLSGGTYNGTTGRSTFTLPYNPNDVPVIVLAAPGGAAPAGTEYPVVAASGASITVSGDLTAQPIRVGTAFPSRYTFSTLQLRDDQGKATERAGRLQIRHIDISYAQSSYFRVEVTTPAGAFSYPYTGRSLADFANVLGDIAQGSGVFSVPVLSRNDRATIALVNDTWKPSAYISAEWRGTWNPNQRE